MNIRISGYVDEAFENISSDLHNHREFTACASEIVEVLDKYGMRYCEVHTLLECLLKTFYRYSHDSHDDMQIYAVKELFFEKMEEIKHLIKSRLDEAGIHHATLEFECIGVSCETENNCC